MSLDMEIKCEGLSNKSLKNKKAGRENVRFSSQWIDVRVLRQLRSVNSKIVQP